MNERLSSIERVVAQKSYEHAKLPLEQYYIKNFLDETRERCNFEERKKTEQEKNVLRLVNKATNAAMERYGGKPLNLGPQHEHIVPAEKFQKLFEEEEDTDREDTHGVFLWAQQGILMKDYQDPVVLAVLAYHETLHFKAYNAVQVLLNKTEGTPKTLQATDYRIGLAIKSRDGEHLYFSNMNEAVTEELTQRFVANELPAFAPLDKELKRSKAILRNATDWREKGFYYATLTGEKKEPSVFYFGFIYQQQRVILNLLIDKLYERNQEHFQDREEVFGVFASATVSGKLLTLARLVDGTFGKGTFTKLGELDEKLNEQEQFVKSL